jgi:hypothetical protein
VTPHVVGKVTNGLGRRHRLTGAASLTRPLTPTRGRAGPGARRPPRTRAGFPLERQRKLGIRDENGYLVRLPYLRPVNGRNRPHDWHAWSPTQQLEFLLGMSLDDISEIMSLADPRT